MFTLKSIMQNNGGTLNSKGEVVSYNKGYQVSYKDLYIVPAYRLRKSFLIWCLDCLKESDHLGIWVDNGKVYIDLSEHIATKKEALKLGKKRNQLSVWSWKAGEAIAC